MNFKHTVFLGLMLTFLSGCTGSEPQPNGESEIREAMKMQQAAWNTGDIDGFMAFYNDSPELTFTGGSGITKGFDTVLARYKKNYATKSEMGALHFDLKELRRLGQKHFLVIGSWELNREPDHPKGFFSLIWEKTPDGWKIIHDHTR